MLMRVLDNFEIVKDVMFLVLLSSCVIFDESELGSIFSNLFQKCHWSWRRADKELLGRVRVDASTSMRCSM